MNKVNDCAIPSISGYIFQIEKALLLLPELATDEFVSIEQVDDVAKHDGNGTVVLSIQAKHSISKSGTTFPNTSLSLWRTFEIWITKLKEGVFNINTIFCCSTNKEISSKSLLYFMKNNDFKTSIYSIVELQMSLKEKLPNMQRGGKHVSRIIQLIDFALANRNELEVIHQNLEIKVDGDPKTEFLNKIHYNSRNRTQKQKDACYDEFCGWIVNTCKAKWKNSEQAVFCKKDFDTKYHQILNNPSIVNAIFSSKKELEEIGSRYIDNFRDALFVKQIKDLVWKKDAKERAIHLSIIDYICADIELKNIIDNGDYTEEDFNEFTELCETKWLEWVDILIIKDLDEYTEDEKNTLAIQLFNKIMKELEMQFRSNLFTDSTKYIQNGTFLKLSNSPKIGWHPDWEKKYIAYDLSI